VPVVIGSCVEEKKQTLHRARTLSAIGPHLHVNNSAEQLLHNRLNDRLEGSSLVHEAHGELSRGEANLALEPALENVGVEIPAINRHETNRKKNSVFCTQDYCKRLVYLSMRLPSTSKNSPPFSAALKQTKAALRTVRLPTCKEDEQDQRKHTGARMEKYVHIQAMCKKWTGDVQQTRKTQVM
jgi:hypothetical protein